MTVHVLGSPLHVIVTGCTGCYVGCGAASEECTEAFVNGFVDLGFPHLILGFDLNGSTVKIGNHAVKLFLDIIQVDHITVLAGIYHEAFIRQHQTCVHGFRHVLSLNGCNGGIKHLMIEHQLNLYLINAYGNVFIILVLRDQRTTGHTRQLCCDLSLVSAMYAHFPEGQNFFLLSYGNAHALGRYVSHILVNLGQDLLSGKTADIQRSYGNTLRHDFLQSLQRFCRRIRSGSLFGLLFTFRRSSLFSLCSRLFTNRRCCLLSISRRKFRCKCSLR